MHEAKDVDIIHTKFSRLDCTLKVKMSINLCVLYGE